MNYCHPSCPICSGEREIKYKQCSGCGDDFKPEDGETLCPSCESVQVAMDNGDDAAAVDAMDRAVDVRTAWR